MNNWNTSETINEIQEVRVSLCEQHDGNESNCNNTFKLIYQGITTIPLSQNTDAESLEQALNTLSSIHLRGYVNVSSSVSNNVTTFRIEFSFSGPNSVQLLTSDSGNATNVIINIRRMRIGGSASAGFKLRYGGAISDPIMPSQVTESSLKKTLVDLFSTECTKSPSTGKKLI
jgi:hypothetical protein